MRYQQRQACQRVGATGSTRFRATRWMLHVVGVAVLVTLLAAGPAGATQSFPTPPHRTDPGGVYLSLGDSIAFGLQERILDEQLETGNLDPSAFPGFGDELTRKLARLHPGIQQVNLGCPGETTDSFREACEYPFGLHVDYPGSSQLDAALPRFARSAPDTARWERSPSRSGPTT